jgi:ubiquinone/menaquinone biosynthesis C-methylase UbiE
MYNEDKMKEISEKRQWYDGWFYALFLDSKESRTRRKMLKIIEPESTVIDIGCGTGGFGLKLAEKCEMVVGVDLSAKMIKVANKRKVKERSGNVHFHVANAMTLSQVFKEKFDYATFSFFIHEIDSADRVEVLKEAKKIANNLVIYDYQTPLPYNIFGLNIRIVEFLAGRSHHRNFRKFTKNGGLHPVLQAASLEITTEKTNRTGVFKLIVAR